MLGTITQLARFKDLVLTLVRFGFEDILDRMDLPGIRDLYGKRTTDPIEGTWVRIRQALEHMGPTYVKFGQVMSLRPDLLPSALIRELARLQDQVLPEGFEAMEQVVSKSLGRPWREVFSELDERPLASASLSQVHRAVLLADGREVAVKVQRPGIRKAIKGDLELLRAVAELLHEKISELAFYDLPRLVEVASKTLWDELDFSREARNMGIARSLLPQDSPVAVPDVIADLSSERMLVMELIRGERLEDYIAREGERRRELAVTGLGYMLRQILEHGFFHADPHPGNIMLGFDGKIYMVDWGMVGRLSESYRFKLVELIIATVDRDVERLTDAILELVRQEGEFNRQSLETDLADVIDSYYTRELKDLNVGRLMYELTSLVRRYGLHLSAEYAVMLRALVTAEGTARRLQPDLNVVAEAEPVVCLLAARRYNPRRMWRKLRRNLFQLFTLQSELPQRLIRIAEKAENGELSIRFEHHNLASLERTLERVSNRLTIGIIIAAMLIASSMVISTGVGPQLGGLPALGVIGYIISGMLGIWLIFIILRRRRF